MQDFELSEVMNKLANYKARRETSRFYLSVPDLLALDEEIERLERRQRELMSGTAKSGKAHTRNDRMTEEIKQALSEAGPDAEPVDVMRILKSYAGKAGSCITEARIDGISWKSASSQTEKLMMPALKARLRRLKQRGR